MGINSTQNNISSMKQGLMYMATKTAARLSHDVVRSQKKDTSVEAKTSQNEITVSNAIKTMLVRLS